MPVLHHQDCPLRLSLMPYFTFLPDPSNNYLKIRINCLRYPQCKTYEQINIDFNETMKQTRSIFVTINFGKKTDDEIKALIIRFRLNEILTQRPAIYNYEFYNSQCEPHFHIHTLQKLNAERVRKKRIINKIAKKANLAENYIDYKFSNNLERYITWSNYIKGIKQQKKQESVDMDAEKREDLKLKCFYIL